MLYFSAKLVHNVLTRQLVTAKNHELWFVFERRPLRFSLQKFHAVTGLNCKDDGNYDLNEWVDDGGFWSRLLKSHGLISIETIRKKHVFEANKWTRVDRLRLVYLCLAALLMAVDEKSWVSHDYIKVIMDFDKMFKLDRGCKGELENVLVNKRHLYSYISSTGNMDVMVDQDFARNDEMREERVDRMEKLISENKNWSSCSWEFEEPVETTRSAVPSARTESDVVHNEGVETGEVLRTTCGEATTSSGSRTGKRKVVDKGAEARKKRLLFHRSVANAEEGSESSMRALFDDYEKRMTNQSDEKYEKLATEFSQLKSTVSELKDMLVEALSRKTVESHRHRPNQCLRSLLSQDER
ncbi:unnamed protein product [Microthlaspi erraticum]|uniref:DUF1985 domain-containing protein n=1 Tax=Microthlaspi erraticum TaxID=1685480 RepID=A0A6D2IDB8_9BRAS|nr:unnamed protein product [Microthlaspi erraticum]